MFRLRSSRYRFSPFAMSKRRGGTTHIQATRVKKRRGVGSRTITVLDSDEELPPATTNEYARATKTRVGPSGKAERVVMSSIPIIEEEVDIHVPLEVDANVPVDAVAENVVLVSPAKKRRKRANDSVSV